MLRSACWSVLNAVNNRKYKTAGVGQSSDQVIWCAQCLLNIFGDSGGMWRLCSSAPEHTHFLPPLKATLGSSTWYFPGWTSVCLGYWMSHHGASMSSAGREKCCYLWHSSLSCAQHWPHWSLAASALGSWESQQAGLAAAQGTCNPGSGLQTKWHVGIPTMLG